MEVYPRSAIPLKLRQLKGNADTSVLYGWGLEMSGKLDHASALLRQIVRTVGAYCTPVLYFLLAASKEK